MLLQAEKMAEATTLNESAVHEIVKMAEATTLNESPIHEILPAEIFVNVLKRLDFKSIVNAKKTCKKWKKIIENFKLVEGASSKFELSRNF